MPLDPSAFAALAAACAPAVAPQTLLAIAQVESGLDPLAIGVNGAGGGALRPGDREAAVARARDLIAAGHSVDLGLGQINSRNLGWLGLSVAGAFDPCRNLAASARVLQAGYRRARPAASGEQAALRTALSYYNTGGPTRGLRNGYVAKVVAAAAAAPSVPPTQQGSAPPPAAWDVFARARRPAPGGALVFATDPGGQP